MLQNDFRKRSLFQQVNDRIRELNASFGAPMPVYHVLCECTSSDCTERIEIPGVVHEDVRRDPDRFLVAPQHERPGEERVVSEGSTYRVVRLRGATRRPAALRVAPADVPAA